MLSGALAKGFASPVHDAQVAFRAVLSAMSEPARVVGLDCGGITAPGLTPAAAVLLLTLADHETPVWLDGEAARAADWLRFHTGAKLASQPEDAMFAVVDGAGPDAPLDRMSCGDDRYPDRSATVIMSCAALAGGTPLVCRGPGIDGSREIAPAGLGGHVWVAWAANTELFPRGFDLILVSGADIIALPRTTRVSSGGRS